jgi:hypothetical protein
MKGRYINGIYIFYSISNDRSHNGDVANHVPYKTAENCEV